MVFKTKNSVFKQTKNSFNVKKKEKNCFYVFSNPSTGRYGIEIKI